MIVERGSRELYLPSIETKTCISIYLYGWRTVELSGYLYTIIPEELIYNIVQGRQGIVRNLYSIHGYWKLTLLKRWSQIMRNLVHFNKWLGLLWMVDGWWWYYWICILQPVHLWQGKPFETNEQPSDDCYAIVCVVKCRNANSLKHVTMGLIRGGGLKLKSSLRQCSGLKLLTWI